MPDRSPGYHLATLGHDGRFWDVYLEPDADEAGRGGARGRLVFSPADASEDEVPVATGFIFVESSIQSVVGRAQAMSPHQLLALLRSCLP